MMGRILLVAMLLTSYLMSPAKSQTREQASVTTAAPAILSSLAPLCGERDADWGDWLLQSTAAEVQFGEPMDGTGMFAAPEPRYFNRSLGEVEMAAVAGAKLFERYQRDACVLVAQEMIGKADFDVRELRKQSMQRLLPVTGIEASTPSSVLDATWLTEAAQLATRCGARNTAWGRDAVEGVAVAVMTAMDEAHIRGASDDGGAWIQAEGGKSMAAAVVNMEFFYLRKTACAWVKSPGALTHLDELIQHWRDVVRRTKAGDWSGAGGIK